MESDEAQGRHHGDARELVGYGFLRVFANDRTIDAGELAMLEHLATRDGVVDEREKEVLATIFARVQEEDVTPEVWTEMQRFRAAYGF